MGMLRRSSCRRLRRSGLGALSCTPGVLALAMICQVGLAVAVYAQDPYADEVVSFQPGSGAGFGQDLMPEVVLGPPFGAGPVTQSLDVVSLGNDGRITVAFTDSVICNGEGPDFTVFENVFYIGSADGPPFTEVGIVAVSQDGVDYFEFPYDAVTLEGLAGRTPVFSHPDNGIDATDPTVSGGDAFDLADVGLEWASHVRITDPGAAIADAGNMLPPGIFGGFDLDAVAIVNPCGASTTTTTTTTTTTMLAEPGCGNGQLDPGEECDDGHQHWEAGQWCTPDCATVACGDPDNDTSITAIDALLVLKVSVGAASCDERVCNVDGSTRIPRVTSTDALTVLRAGVGLPGALLECIPTE